MAQENPEITTFSYFSDKPIDRLYSDMSAESQNYKNSIEEHVKGNEPKEVKARSALHTRAIANLDDLLKDAAKEIGVPLKEQDRSNDGAISVKDIKKIYAYADSRIEEYRNLNTDDKETHKFHTDTIKGFEKLEQEARVNAAEFVKAGKYGQIEVKNQSPAGTNGNSHISPNILAKVADEGRIQERNNVKMSDTDKIPQIQVVANTALPKSISRGSAEI